MYQKAAQNRLYVKLAERLLALDPGIEAYLKRPPLIEDLCFTGENGQALEFRATTSAEMISFHTAIGDFEVAFLDENTLAIGLPTNARCGIRMEAASKGYQARGPAGTETVRSVAYSSSANVLRDQIAETPDGYRLDYQVKSERDSCILLRVGQENMAAPNPVPFSKIRAGARARWEAWFNLAPPVAETYQKKYAYAWWVMANNLVSPLGCVTYEAMMPTKAFYLGIWLWDSALHAIAFRHVDPELARNQLRVMLAHQLPDGMLPDAVFDEGVVSEIDHPIPARVTKPPILAWAALKLHETNPDLDFLREIYPPLARCNDWWFRTNSDDADGLAQYTHPYSSGLDNSPLWEHGMPVESPDLNTYLNIQMNSLAAIAEILDKNDEAALWRARAKALALRMLEDLWDEEAGLFRALRNGRPIPVITPFNLYPLWTGQIPNRMVKRLVAHLKNPDEFWGKYMIPTVARNDPAYNPEAMWRGPVWANINYFFVEALQKVGETELARELRDKTLDMIMDQPGIYEYYNPETGEPPATAANMFGWTAAVFIELALQATAGSESAALKEKE